MAVLQDININVHGQPSEKRLQTFLRLSQNENGRMINFRVLGPPLPSNCTATFSGTKPDGNVYSKTGTVAGNFVVIQEDMQMTAVAGVWDAKLDIINGSHNIMTALIRVVVDADVVDPDAIASDSQLQGLVAEAKYYAEHARTDAYGSPLTAPTKAQMTDHTRVYVYTGSEPNMVAGNWYYWNGSAWVSGGVYNAVAVQTDTTLSVAGKAADGKAAGDAIEELKEDLSSVSVDVYEIINGTDTNNIIDFDDGTVTSHGVTFTKNALNKTITTSGSVSDTGSAKCDIMRFTCNETGVYYVSGCPLGGGTTPPCYRIGIWDHSDDTDATEKSETGDGLFVTLIAGTQYSIYIQAKGQGLNMDGKVFRPSVVNVSEYNEMAFESETVESRGITYVKNAETGTVTANGTVSDQWTSRCDLMVFAPTETAQYFIGGCPIGGGDTAPFYRIGIWDNSASTDFSETGNGLLRTLTAGVRYNFYIQIKGQGYTVSNLVFNPSITKVADYRGDDDSVSLNSLNTAVQDLQRATTNTKQIVNILDLGAKNDGSTDVGAIINANTANASIFLPVGKYLVTTPIVLVNSLIGETRIRDYTSSTSVKAASALISGLSSGTIITLGSSGGSVTIANLNIYCNSNEDAISLGSTYRLCNIDNVGINNLGDAVGILRGASGSRNLYANNVSIFAKPLKASTGIKATAGNDDRLTNIEIMFCQIGLNISGPTLASNIHVWTGANASHNPTHAWFVNTAGLVCSGSFFGTNVFLDTSYNFIHSKSGKIWLHNLITWDDTVASQYENEVNLIKKEGTGYLSISGGSYRSGRTNINGIAEGEAVNFIGL